MRGLNHFPRLQRWLVRVAIGLGALGFLAMAFGILLVRDEPERTGGARLRAREELFSGARLSTERLPGQWSIQVARAYYERRQAGFLVLGASRRLVLEDLRMVVLESKANASAPPLDFAGFVLQSAKRAGETRASGIHALRVKGLTLLRPKTEGGAWAFLRAAEAELGAGSGKALRLRNALYRAAEAAPWQPLQGAAIVRVGEETRLTGKLPAGELSVALALTLH